jgi:hypothetical protein
MKTKERASHFAACEFRPLRRYKRSAREWHVGNSQSRSLTVRWFALMRSSIRKQNCST